MDAEFWHRRWVKNEIPFHEGNPNALLVKHFPTLSLTRGQRVFVPLCGKTVDIHWLRAGGYRVAGAELSEIAVSQLFAEAGLKPKKSDAGKLIHYSAESIDIFVGDIFELTRELLGPVDAIYDRAALVAFPEAMRDQYTAHLRTIAGGVPQLLITFEYDQSAIKGPPFSVCGKEIERHYGQNHALTSLERVPFPGGLKGKCEAEEVIWLLQPNEKLK